MVGPVSQTEHSRIILQPKFKRGTKTTSRRVVTLTLVTQDEELHIRGRFERVEDGGSTRQHRIHKTYIKILPGMEKPALPKDAKVIFDAIHEYVEKSHYSWRLVREDKKTFLHITFGDHSKEGHSGLKESEGPIPDDAQRV